MRAKNETAYGVESVACACATIRRASRAVTQLYDTWLRDHGIEGPQFALLAMLDRLGECSHTTMGQRFDLDKTTLSRHLKLLKKRGWIQIARGIDARDRRVTLTPARPRRLAAARPAWQKAQSQLRSAFGGREWDTMLRVLDGVTHAARLARRPGRGQTDRGG